MPDTVAAQIEVCAVVIEGGVAATTIPVTVGAVPVIAIVAEPDTFANPRWAEWATQVPVPGPVGVKTPACVMVPPVAVQVTVEL